MAIENMEMRVKEYTEQLKKLQEEKKNMEFEAAFAQKEFEKARAQLKNEHGIEISEDGSNIAELLKQEEESLETSLIAGENILKRLQNREDYHEQMVDAQPIGQGIVGELQQPTAHQVNNIPVGVPSNVEFGSAVGKPFQIPQTPQTPQTPQVLHTIETAGVHDTLKASNAGIAQVLVESQSIHSVLGGVGAENEPNAQGGTETSGFFGGFEEVGAERAGSTAAVYSETGVGEHIPTVSTVPTVPVEAVTEGVKVAAATDVGLNTSGSLFGNSIVNALGGLSGGGQVVERSIADMMNQTTTQIQPQIQPQMPIASGVVSSTGVVQESTVGTGSTNVDVADFFNAKDGGTPTLSF